MDSIASQSATQSLAVYSEAMARGMGVAVDSSSGKIRIMTVFDRVASKLAQRILDIDLAATWKSKAKQLIADKFEQEARILKLPDAAASKLKTAVESAIQPDTHAFTKNNLRSAIFKNSGGDSVVEKALINIFDAHDNSNRAASHFYLMAIEKEGADIPFARTVANNAAKWKADLDLTDHQAFTLSYDAQKIQKQFRMPIPAAMRIRLDAEWLIGTYKIKNSEAIRFAVDLQPILVQMDMTMQDLPYVYDHVMEGKFEGKDRLKSSSVKTKLSAAICYAQLSNEGKSDREALEIISMRLHRAEFIQQKLPAGCKVECIHQGAHIRASYSLDDNELQVFKKVTESLSKYPLEDGKKFPGVEKLKLFEKQFVTDCLRNNLHAAKNGKPDPVFTPLESTKQERIKRFTKDQMVQWVDALIGYAGSEKAAGTMSYFLSQTIFGNILELGAKKSRNPAGDILRAGGKTGTNDFSFRMDKSDAKPGVTIVAGEYLENPNFLMTGEYLPDGAELTKNFIPFRLPLIPPAGEGERATQDANAVRYNCVFELANSDMEAGIITSTPRSLSISYDLVLNEMELDLMQASGELK